MMLKQYMGDRPFAAFSRTAFLAFLGQIAIATGVAWAAGLSSAAWGQAGGESAPAVTPAIAPVTTPEIPALPAQGLSGVNAEPENSIVPESAGDRESVGQGNAPQPTLRFSDVSPDHWAYEALLYLSTGGRSLQVRP